MSDSQTDYFDPAYWEGIAVKNGFILVVDGYKGGTIGGDFIKKSYDHKLLRRITKLQTLADNHAATQGERENALAMIAKFDSRVVTEILTKGDFPSVTYQKNPKGSKWHIEKNGEILAKGLGIYAFGDVNTWREEPLLFNDINRMSGAYVYEDTTQEEWDKHLIYRREAQSKKILLLDKYFKLLDKWESLAIIKLGEGEENKLIKKTIQKKNIYFIAVDSSTPTKYIRVGDKWNHFHGVRKNFVYKISDDKKNLKKLTKSWTSFENTKSQLTYKKEPNKNTKGIYNTCSDANFENLDIIYVDLIEKIEISEEIIYVKETKKSTKKNKNKKPSLKPGICFNCDKEVKKLNLTQLCKKCETLCSLEDKKYNEKYFEKLINEGTVEDYEHTKTKDILNVLKLGVKLSTEIFKKFTNYLYDKDMGYYSNYAKGFVLTNYKNVATSTTALYCKETLVVFANGTLF